MGIAAPVATMDDVEKELRKIRDEFPDATHHCWAYVLGNPDAGPRMRFDDGGEPSGTAGKPILNVLQRRKVGDALVVVVRWFGGVKLGAGGLVRAYSRTASRVLELADVAALTKRSPLLMRLEYGDEQTARRVLTRLGIEVLSAEYADRTILRVLASEDEGAALVREISAATSGRAEFGPPADAV